MFALLCLILVSFFTYSSYSLWNQTYSQNDSNIIAAGCFELEVNDLDENKKSTAINLTNTYPMSEERGLATNPYILTIKNICDVPSEYTVILNEFNGTSLSNDLIRYHIKENNVESSTLLLSTTQLYELDDSLKYEIETNQNKMINQSYNLASGYLNKNDTVSYELRIWLDYNATNDAMNKTFEAGITVLSTSPH